MQFFPPENVEKSSAFSCNVVTYISGFVARQLSNTLSCDACRQQLFSDDADLEMPPHPDVYKTDLIDLKDKGGLVYPSRKLVYLCAETERVITQLNDFSHSNIRDRIRVTVMNTVRSAFVDDHESGLNSHAFQLSKQIIHLYVKIRFHSLSRSLTEAAQGANIRCRLTKSVLFAHQ